MPYTTDPTSDYEGSIYQKVDQQMCDWGWTSWCVYKPPAPPPAMKAPPEALQPPYVVTQEDINRQAVKDFNDWKKTAIPDPNSKPTDNTMLYVIGGAILVLLITR